MYGIWFLVFIGFYVVDNMLTSSLPVFSDWLWYVDAVMTEAALTSDPVILERLEVIDAVPEPTIVDATEVVIVNNQLLTSQLASEL